mgnify:CR=1 FL=1
MPVDLCFVFGSNVVVSTMLLKHSVARQAFDKALKLGQDSCFTASFDKFVIV